MMLITFGIHLYEKCTKNVFLICLVNFENCSNKKISHYGFNAYPYPNTPAIINNFETPD
jgi:hypothetical protein